MESIDLPLIEQDNVLSTLKEKHQRPEAIMIEAEKHRRDVSQECDPTK